MIIYLTGIDGSGKSTVIEKIKTDIFPNENINVIWARYESKIMKFIVQPFKKVKTNGSTNFNDMNEIQYNSWHSFKSKITKNKWLSNKILLIQYLEFSHKINKVFKEINKTHVSTIVDRFILDFIVDQSVNHNLDEHNWIVKRLLLKLAEFDKIIYLDVDEEVAFKRKNDIPSIEYLTSRRSYYKKYISLLKNATLINNNNSLDNTILQIKKILQRV